jgi:hypothetical protein
MENLQNQPQSQEQETFVILSKGVANALFNYLGSKPYGEVSDLMNAVISNLQGNAAKYKIIPNMPQDIDPSIAEKLAQASAEAKAKVEQGAEFLPEGNNASSE